MESYYLVEFLEEGDIAIIPHVWIIDDCSCYWPSSNHRKHLDNKTTPGTLWQKYNIKILLSSGKLFFFYLALTLPKMFNLLFSGYFLLKKKIYQI